MAGRKPIPDSIKIANGTFRGDRAKDVPSVPLAEKPKPPACLKAEGKRRWNDLCEWLSSVKLLEARYVHMMELYCRAWDRLEHYEKAPGKREFTVTESGYVSAHPATALAKQARDEIRRIGAEFGLTASSARSIAPAKKDRASVPSRRRDMA